MSSLLGIRLHLTLDSRVECAKDTSCQEGSVDAVVDSYRRDGNTCTDDGLVGCPQNGKYDKRKEDNIPLGIWTMLYRLSTPSSELPLTGTPMTGRTVCAAAIPGRWAAPPAAAIMTLMPRAAALAEYSAMNVGVRWAEVMSTAGSMPK